MAFVDEENLDPNAPAPSGGGSTLISGQGGSSSNRPTGAAPTSPDAPGGMPGNFVGIQQYINANKPQSQQLANNVAGYVNDLGNTARSTQQSSGEQFQQAVDQNTVDLNKDLYSKAQSNPDQVASDAAQKSEFQKMYNANYAGPSSFESSDFYKPAQTSTKAATDAASLIGTPEGQKQVVSNFQKSSAGYSNPGALTFDSLLLQGAPNARDTLSNAASNQKDLQANLDALASEKNLAAKNAATTTNATGQTVRGTFGNEQLQTAIQNALIKKASDAQTAASSTGQSVIEKLNKGQQLSPDELTSIGLNPQKVSQIYEGEKTLPNITPYISVGNPSINAQNIATPEDYARYQALNELTGQKANYLSNPALANTANTNALSSFDFDRYLKDLQNAQPKPKIEPSQQNLNGIYVPANGYRVNRQ